MGKSDGEKPKEKVHKPTNGESKQKNKPRFNTDGGLRHSQWSNHFRKICEYKIQFGHCQVPQQYSANPKLGQWVSRQRSNYRKHTEEEATSMTAEHIRALDGIGFNWGTKRSDLASVWKVPFQQLCEFKLQFGHCLVPFKYSANPKLGPWVSKQRSNYRLYQEGKPCHITAERIRELESVGFEWEPNSLCWDERFEELREFKLQFGHCLVPQLYSADPKLGIWVTNQRSRYRLHQEGKPSPMTAERIRELESIGFEWGKPSTASWNERFEQLRVFTVQFGHCLVPQLYSANRKLGRWVSTQRSNYKLYQEGKPSPLTAERIRELESVGFEPGTPRGTPSARSWNEHFEQLRVFAVQFGHCLVPFKYSANPKLGSWVSKQRSNYKLYQGGKPCRITAECIRELESVGFEWEPHSLSWDVRFEQLREFTAQFGHYLMPQLYSANPKLGIWVTNQRSRYRLHQEGKPSPMTAERIRELESIGFEWGTPSAVSWNERFEQLRKFRAQFGHCLVPNRYSADPKLGRWVSTQRSNYKLYQEGKPSHMTAERIRKLESVEFKYGHFVFDPPF